MKPSERERILQAVRDTVVRIGHQLLSDSKTTVTKSEKGAKTSDVRGRDLLSLLVKANTSPNLLDSQKMSDEDVLARMYLFVSHYTLHLSLTFW